MPTFSLALDEQLLCSRVLELQLNTNRKGNPKLVPLSFYTSEVKGRAQITRHLMDLAAGKKLSENPGNHDRYFNTLFNQGLVSGTRDSPALTAFADPYLAAAAQIENQSFWRGDEGDAIELEVIRRTVAKLRNGEAVSNFFKEIWFNVQSFFNWVPASEVNAVLADSSRMLFLFQIGSMGWEVARYFRLNQSDRDSFEAIFMKVPQTDSWSPAAPIEIAAAKYKDAGAVIQDDVRYRISGFLNAYAKLKAELGSNLPYFDRDYVLRANGGSDSGPDDIADKPLNVHPPTFLTHPHQLIVTGCPGSGKSYFVDQLLQAQPCKVFRTQFHPESSFFDFVGAYKPQPVYEAPDPATPLLQGDNSTFGRGRPLIDYRFVPGPLMQGVAYAYSHPGEHVIVLIDELNRGNAAAILGDILQLLDRDGSGFSRYAIKASQEIKSFFSDQGLTVDELRLPSNLYLWATMNSADQGVFPLDTAFRRRWSYVYKGYSEPCLYSDSTVITYGGESYQWDLFRSALNSKLIELGIHEDKLIGPYFLTEAQIADSKSVLEKLFLYIYDDVLRFRQDTFFVVKSFSLVADNWKAGMGKPLKIDLPMPISVPPLDEVAPVSPPAEHAVNTANAENVEVEAGILDSTAMDTAA